MLLLMPGSVRNITALFINPSFVDILGAFIMHPSEPSRFPEWAAIAPSVTKRVLTTCPPESLFIATVCLRAEHHPYSAHSAPAEGKGTSVPLDFCIIYLVLKILIVAKRHYKAVQYFPKLQSVHFDCVAQICAFSISITVLRSEMLLLVKYGCINWRTKLLVAAISFMECAIKSCHNQFVISASFFSPQSFFLALFTNQKVSLWNVLV